MVNVVVIEGVVVVVVYVVFVSGDVDFDDVVVFEWVWVRDVVIDNFVDVGVIWFGVVMVIEGWWVGVVVVYVFVSDVVEFVGGDFGFDGFFGFVYGIIGDLFSFFYGSDCFGWLYVGVIIGFWDVV